LMADYNLLTLPVVDEDGRPLGVVTVDDVLETTLPEDWWRREPALRHDTADETSADDTADDTADDEGGTEHGAETTGPGGQTP
jgi:hypothetical protein